MALVHIYTKTVYRIQRTEGITIKNLVVNWEVRAMPHLCDLYPGICLTTE
jgi:hypothetical protein